jgi:hypothetical protein
MLQVFSSKTARAGGVIRRRLRDVDRIVGRDVFLNELRRRGFHAVENGGDIVVFCNAQPIRRVV